MNKHSFFNFIKNPPLWYLCTVWFCTLAACGGSVALVVIGYTGVWSYAVYAVAAVLLAYAIYCAVRFAPTLKRRFLQLAGKYKFTGKLVNNYGFRTVAFMCVSLTVNVGFVVFNTVSAIVTHSMWYVVFAAYNFLLGAMRAGVFFGERNAKRKAHNDYDLLHNKFKVYRSCGIALLVLEIVTAGAVALMIFTSDPTSRSGIMAIVFAVYTVYKVVLSIVNDVRARLWDPTVQAIRNIGLADAALSLLSLQTSLISAFSQGNELFWLNAVTGGAVCLLALCLGIIMTVRGQKQMNALKKMQAAQLRSPLPKEGQNDDGQTA